MEKINDNHTPMIQRDGALAYAANGSLNNAQGTTLAIKPATGLALVAKNALAGAKQAEQTPPSTSCQQCLTLNFFFDGTGNNLDADIGTMQHSNVARLFTSRLPDDSATGRYSFYVYGLGTYFKEIGDDGHSKTGLGMGAMGQERLDWAFARLSEAVKRAEARAQNPSNKIRSIKVSVFGFSRGSAAARAFVRDLHKKCIKDGGTILLMPGRYPIEVIFLGLFDTVSSVGIPMSGNNTELATTAGIYSIKSTLALRASRNLNNIAFGEPGADPAPGIHDGHMSWGDGLKVPAPDLVKQCVHMVAGHEIRNSFPSDSVLNGHSYPENTIEMVYPGAHSDVGGGYQAREGGRGEEAGDMLSLIPLRVMHQLARAAGVPLMDLTALLEHKDKRVPISFAIDTDGATRYANLHKHFNAYMQAAGSGGRDIGSELLNHMSWYLRWRMHNINQNQKAASSGLKGRDAAKIQASERDFAKNRILIQKQVDAAKADWIETERQYTRLSQEITAKQMAQARSGVTIDNKENKARLEQATKKKDAKRDVYLAEKAKLDSYADDSLLIDNLEAYDAQLIKDAKMIITHQKRYPELKLRPHYRNLVEAYQDEFFNNKGLSDKTIIAFFDNYVHDSLAGFATDATLPSDPRVVYIGGDNKLKYAEAEDANDEFAA